MSSGSEPEIYLRGVIPHTLIYGGLGHRPPPYEELIFSVSIAVLDVDFWEECSHMIFRCISLYVKHTLLPQLLV